MTTSHAVAPQKVSLVLAQQPDADALLSRDAFALLVGMLLDQQVPMEWAFSGPWLLAQRLGRDLDPVDIARRDEAAFAALCALTPAIHRYPAAMAGRIQSLARYLVDHYGGDAEALWRDAPNGAELLARLEALPGFGAQKSRIFVALLGKQLGVRPRGWRAAAGPYGEAGSHRSVADVTGPDSLAKVRAHKKQLKAAAKAARSATTA
jgi:uncharacterized HhH-GPD family protein